MAVLVPEILYSYLLLFRPHFTKPSFVYFSGYILSVLLTGGRKTMSRVANTCFFVDRHLVSWERFLAENRWDPLAVVGTLLKSLRAKLDDELQVHGAFLSVIDTLLIAKNGYRMLGIQKWKDHSDNADRGERIRGHHWALVGLISYSQHWRRYLCFPVLMQLISGQLNPSLIMVDPAGVATLATIWDSIHPLLYQLHQHLNKQLCEWWPMLIFLKPPLSTRC